MRDALSVVGSACRLLFRHWPVLLAVVFAGLAVRQAILWLAIKASLLHSIVGFLVFAFVPMTMLLMFMLMLRIVRPSLAAASQSNVVSSFGSALVPFMTIYVAFDYFVEDERTYRWLLLREENSQAFNPDNISLLDRAFWAITYTHLWVIGIAVALRFGLSFWQRTKETPWIGYVRAYLEVCWVALVLNGIIAWFFQEGWYSDRRVVRWFSATWEGFLDSLGPLKDVGAFLGEALKSMDTTIVVPVAWLTIGVIVFGRRRDPNAAPEPKGPKAVRWVLTDARQEFAPLADAWQVVRAAGMRAMLLFCLGFLLANSSRHWLWQLERAIIGPQELNVVWLALVDPLTEFNRAISIVLIICLVAAAADRVLASLPEPTADGQAQEVGQPVNFDDPQGDGLGTGRSGEVHGGLVRA